jgi:hypothetical protein
LNSFAKPAFSGFSESKKTLLMRPGLFSILLPKVQDKSEKFVVLTVHRRNSAPINVTKRYRLPAESFCGNMRNLNVNCSFGGIHNA